MKNDVKYLFTIAVLLMVLAMPAAAQTAPLINGATMHSVGNVPAAPLAVIAEQDYGAAAEHQGLGIGAGSSDITAMAAHRETGGDGAALASVGGKTKHDGWDDQYQDMVKQNHIAHVNTAAVKRTAWRVLNQYH